MKDSDLFYGIPYSYDSQLKRWTRCGVGDAILYYSQDRLDKMEYVGDTDKDYTFVRTDDINTSYLLVKEEQCQSGSV